MRKSRYPKSKSHVFRFLKSGKPNTKFFKKPRRPEKREFPSNGSGMDKLSYALAFYRANAATLRFVGVDYEG